MEKRIKTFGFTLPKRTTAKLLSAPLSTYPDSSFAPKAKKRLLDLSAYIERQKFIKEAKQATQRAKEEAAKKQKLH